MFTLLAGWIVFEVSDHKTSLLRVISFAVPEMALFYLNLLWLSPKFLDQDRIRTYYGLIFLLGIGHVILFAPIDS